MAVLEMNKLRLVGLVGECDKIMNTLSESGVFEVSKTRELIESPHTFDSSYLDALVSKQVKVAFAIDYLNRASAAFVELAKKSEDCGEKFEYTPPKKQSGRKIVTRDDLSDGAAKEYELLSVYDALQDISFGRAEIAAELARIDYRISALTPFAKVPLKFSEYGDKKAVSLMLVYTEGATANLDRLEKAEFPSVIEQYETARGTLASVLTLKENRAAAMELLLRAGFSEVEIRDDKTPKEILSECEAKKAALNGESDELLKQALAYEKYLDDFKILYDVIGLEIEKARAVTGFARTESTFVAEGWVPKEAAKTVKERIEAQTDKVCTFITEPEKTDSPPTLVRNNRLVSPFETVTNLYSPPAYGELDPNPFMALFFFVFYGVMMADAGYGVVMTLMSVFALKFMKLEKGMAKIIAIVGISGISAVVWGLLLGGVFGIEGVPALWFNPISEPLPMFGLSLGLGVIQIVFGYGLYAVKCFKNKKYFDGIVDVLFKFTVIIGMLLMLCGMLIEDAPKILSDIGSGTLFASLVGIVATAGHNKPTVVGKIIGGFAGLYDLVNLLSDILSYARIFGLALASAAIGLAFNTLGAMFFGIPIIGYVLGFIVLVPLHAVNLGLGLLSGYIHNARLQFIEFYGKFYEGDGHLFSPLGEKTKYVRLG